jgi:hypothetical protein
MSARGNRLLQIALKGRIITPVSWEDTGTPPWTEFTDKWAGGCAKEPWDYILIQAPPKVACAVFEHVFEHHPRNISCSCCGEEYFVTQASDIDYAKSLFIKAADILPEWVKPKLEWYPNPSGEIKMLDSPYYDGLFLHKAQTTKALDKCAALHGMSTPEMNPEKLKAKFTALYTGHKKKG